MTASREQQIDALIKALMSNPKGRETLMSSLHKNGASLKFHVEAMQFPEITDPERLENAEDGIFLDTETTGVDTTVDKVIQVAMRKFKYDDKGILSVGKAYNKFNDPGIPIPEEVVNLTRITDDDVKGQKIDEDEIAEFIGDASMIMCHNSAFDRKIVEHNFPNAGFNKKSFTCSLSQIDWLKRGENGRSLELLAMKAGYVYGAHNALNDIDVMPFILNQTHEEFGSPFCELLANANRKSLLVVAEYSPFAVKDKLKARGYKWSQDGSDAAGHPKTWWTEINDDPATLAEEADFLRNEIYDREVTVPAYEISSMERFSSRKPSVRRDLRTAEIKSPIDLAAQSAYTGTLQAEMGF